jgi:hypothetical protein
MAGPTSDVPADTDVPVWNQQAHAFQFKQACEIGALPGQVPCPGPGQTVPASSRITISGDAALDTTTRIQTVIGIQVAR